MANQYDVLVGGGSIAGLSFAAVAAGRGLSVLVVEEHDKIGEPEKCDGLVSLRGLKKHGFPPDLGVVQGKVSKGTIHSPGGTVLEIDASRLEVVVLDRGAYDRQVASSALSAGAEILLGTRVGGVREADDSVSVSAGDRTLRASYYVDATGPASAPKSGIIPSAKYEVEAEWVPEGSVDVFLDAVKYPGFFSWSISCGHSLAKVGAAGRGINPSRALDSFLSGREYKLIRKVAAPIYVGGPVESFVEGRRLLVGESAGMVKPTTAGGITTSLAGGVIAAKWLSETIRSGDPSLLSNYRRDWVAEFGGDAWRTRRLREAFERLTNAELDSVVSVLSSPSVTAKLAESDFDLHAAALVSAVGVGGLLKLSRVIASVEARSLLSGL
ncbi:MAG TPA: NAD(P)/FAD-dependent oxidoreductase [Nitrososphaerales archaeon]|nr:NAD(P)/FAD-dependent oxidoreductase [Nitrososphaerales archaeon]